MTNKSAHLQGLYVITDRDLFISLNRPIIDIVAEAIAGGARIVQYRNKISDAKTCREETLALVDLCRSHDITLLINDDVELAKETGADGVHIGQSDISLTEARAILGPEQIIGVTCHNKIDLAQAAQAGGADYVAFGRFFPSQTKPTAPPATMNTLQQAKQLLSIPVVAIGGINRTNAQVLVNHGADMLAVSHAVFAANDIRENARQLSELFA